MEELLLLDVVFAEGADAAGSTNEEATSEGWELAAAVDEVAVAVVGKDCCCCPWEP
jgi:hypothetical protein